MPQIPGRPLAAGGPGTGRVRDQAFIRFRWIVCGAPEARTNITEDIVTSTQ